MTFKITKKFMVFFLSILLLVSLLPVTVSAHEEPAKPLISENTDQIKNSEETAKSDETAKSQESKKTLDAEDADNVSSVDKDSSAGKASFNKKTMIKASENKTEIPKKEVLRSPARVPAAYQVMLGSKKYDSLKDAVKDAKSGDTIYLGEGTYCLKDDIGLNSKDYTVGKELTFVGKSKEKTTWLILKGDKAFDGAEKITFKNMTLQATAEQYLGFFRPHHTVVEDCIINGQSFYWGYTTATFKNTVFNAPKKLFGGEYAIWTYSSPVMTFDSCTFNSYGKTIKVYSDYTADKNDITVNFHDCTVISSSANKQVMDIDDHNKADKRFYINFSGNNIIKGKVGRDVAKPSDANHTATCSRWFGFGGKQDKKNTGRTVVTIDGIKVFEDGHMVSHEINTDHDKYTDGYKDNAYTVSEWEKNSKANRYTRKKVCDYCKTEVAQDGYRITYDPAGGIWKDSSSDIIEKEIVDTHMKQMIEQTPTRKGYIFDGWQLESNPNKKYIHGDFYDEKADDGGFINGRLIAVWRPIEKKTESGSKDKPVSVSNKKTVSDSHRKNMTPETGDSNNMILYVLLSAISSVALIGAIGTKRRKEN